ncbi:MAG: transketolase C-terminal domain-containing protein [Candidatus Margulisiibacteriota bacterium]
MRDAYLLALYDLAKNDDRILALVADNGAIVYDQYRLDFPERFVNFGIAEANMISAAAGLAACGKIPFAYTISCFITMRVFEQIRNDVCLQKMNVKIVGIGTGFTYSNLGPTHQAIEDVALMRVLPNMTIFSPADALETKKVTLAAAQIKGPVFLRLAGSKTPQVYLEDYAFTVGKGVVLQEGNDVAIISTGGIVHEVLRAAAELNNFGISARLINIHTVKPIDKEIIIKAARDTGAVLTVEEHSIIGGLGSAVAEVLAEGGVGNTKFKRLGLMDTFPSSYGSYQDMKEINGLSKEYIMHAVKALLDSKKAIKG